jgi:hypothetical protein
MLLIIEVVTKTSFVLVLMAIILLTRCETCIPNAVSEFVPNPTRLRTL